MVDDPFEGGAVAEAVLVGFFWNSRQRKKAVVDERSFVFAQFHFLNVVVEFFSGFFSFRERVFGLVFVVDVNFGEALAGSYECAENIDIAHLRGSVILSGVTGRACAYGRGALLRRADGSVRPYVDRGCGNERDAGEFAAKIGSVALAVLGVVQDGIDVMEDVPFGDDRSP